MRVLVTGGAGYIGSHTVRQLTMSGHQPVVLDSLERGRSEAALGAPLVVGDIADTALVMRTCRDHAIDACIHFAAYKNVGESMTMPTRYWQNNVAGSINLVSALLECGVERFVFSSSCSVYGTPTQVPVTELAPIQPESVYAETKATVERLLRWHESQGLRSVCLRYFNAAGASRDASIGEEITSMNLIPVVMAATLGLRDAAHVYGDDYATPDGTAIRDYVHVEDLADAHVRALEYLADGGDSCQLNLGTGTGTSVAEIIRLTSEISGREVPHKIVGRRVGDPVAIYADPTLAERALGWKAESSLEQIIATAWLWHSKAGDTTSPG